MDPNQTNTPPAGVLSLFSSIHSGAIHAGGVIPHLVYQEWPKTAPVSTAFRATAGIDVYAEVARVLKTVQPVELAFGVDRYLRDVDRYVALNGVEAVEALSVAHWDGYAWAFGLIPYTFSPRRMMWPILWSDRSWADVLAREMSYAWGVMATAPQTCALSPAMKVPLRTRKGGA